MNFQEISHLRLHNQQVTTSVFSTPKDVVDWMGAMQAQDFTMSRWAVGVRLPGSAESVIEEAFNKGDILRTHLMRPTWHLVSSDDISWMIELTAPSVKSSIRSRRTELELTDEFLRFGFSILEKAMEDGRHATRDELVRLFTEAGISLNDNRAAHILMHAELEGLICSGMIKNNKQTYALLDYRVKNKKKHHREEALALLARKYFQSHSPATVRDFCWWSGLGIRDVRAGMEAIRKDLLSVTVGDETYWILESSSAASPSAKGIFFLPAYDEFLISYTDRTASLLLEHHNKAVSSNGIFKPIIIEDGHVTGIWNRIVKKDKILLNTVFFDEPRISVLKRLEKAVIPYGTFMNKKILIGIV